MAKMPDINLLLNECRFEATRSGGKGGQNVNKVSTKMILLFNVLDSGVLQPDQKDIFLSKLHTRISKDGIFRISSSVDRTQIGNRRKVIEKFISLVEKAFEIETERIETKPTAGSKLRRIEQKKALSGKKLSRSLNWDKSIDE